MTSTLIRATTNERDGRFNVVINGDLDIQPKSQIALKSMFIENEDETISIIEGNRKVTFNQGSNTIEALLAPRDYDSNDYGDLVNDIQDKLNGALTYNETSGPDEVLGGEFHAAINTDLKLQIEWGKGEIGDHLAQFNDNKSGGLARTETTGESGVGYLPVTADVWAVGEAMGDGDVKVAFLTQEIPEGVGYIEAQIFRAINNAAITDRDKNGFMMFFSELDLSAVSVAELEADLGPTGTGKYQSFGLGFAPTAAAGLLPGAGTQYEIVTLANQQFSGIFTNEDGVRTGQGNNPHIRLMRIGNSIKALYDQEVGEGNALMEDIGTVQPGQKLWAWMAFFADERYVEAGMVQATVSKFANELNTPLVKTEDADVEGVRSIVSKWTPPLGLDSEYWPYVPDYTPTNNKLTFETLKLATSLGYESQSIPTFSTIRGINFSAPATNKFGPRINVDEILVLCESFELLSYDGYTPTSAPVAPGLSGNSGRKSILSVVGVDKSDDGKVVYDAPYLQYVSINNREPMLLRNLRFRLVEKDYAPVELFGQASLVVVIKSAENI